MAHTANDLLQPSNLYALLPHSCLYPLGSRPVSTFCPASQERSQSPVIWSLGNCLFLHGPGLSSVRVPAPRGEASGSKEGSKVGLPHPCGKHSPFNMRPMLLSCTRVPTASPGHLCPSEPQRDLNCLVTHSHLNCLSLQRPTEMREIICLLPHTSSALPVHLIGI